ncbi:MAG: type II CRISPR RNA-guided endonuclease Cas9 [Rikenellaceae bacterium]
MAKVLGLDLGTNSIGWAVTNEDENKNSSIIALGSRIIPMSQDDAKEFSTGQAISKNARRTTLRTQRKGYDRYQSRRKNLTSFLRSNDMLPSERLIKLPKLELWQLRARAVSERITLEEIGRVLYHLNQKRGYKSIAEDDSDKKQRDYVMQIVDRHSRIKEENITIGEFFARNLIANKDYRTKEQIFPRKAYIDEFDKIIQCQRNFYSNVLSDENIDILRNRIIYYQRPLKSCKHLVSICEFEKRQFINKHNNEAIYDGPKVAPKSSPIAQVCKIWESVNNITLRNRRNDVLEISPSQRIKLFDHLDNNEKLTLNDLYRILEIKKTDGWWAGKAIGKGLQGNTTKLAIQKSLSGEYSELLKFNLVKIDTENFDSETGEVIDIISDEFQNESLYKLWHVIYSIKDSDELKLVLQKQFNITDPTIIANLQNIDFVKQGYANKSAKAMRRIIPYLELGLNYSDACLCAGFRHSESLSAVENKNRKLQSVLKQIPKNTLRQPIVEKILNQMINVVNTLMAKYGAFDEIRVELARELKQSKDERNSMTKSINRAERINKTIAERISKDYNITPTRSRIQKYKMYEEADMKCFYCEEKISLADFLNGEKMEVEHIIPRSLFFDDSFSNKVCSCRSCNKEKNNRTAYDYMSTKSEAIFDEYVARVDKLFKDGTISKTKRERLLTSGDKIPTDFIDRQLRESQYIAKKSREILTQVCRNVTATSGSVTDRLRNLWGWDKILHNLNFERYKIAGLTETKDREHKGKIWQEEVICDWSKRLDHRHHAIDALVIACTKQGYIQRINNMSELKDISFKGDGKQGDAYQCRLTRLEKYLREQPHPSTDEVTRFVDAIMVSFKAGKKVSSPGKRYIHKGGKRILKQYGIVVPRGALHEESVYGLINVPIIDNLGNEIYEQRLVIKYPISTIKSKDIKYIVDDGIRAIVEGRFKEHNGDDKEVWKDLENNPILFNNAPIRSVRCVVGPLTSAFAKTERGYVKMGNNHHIAIYTDKDGKKKELCTTFWSAVERKNHKLQTVIENPEDLWDNLSNGLSEDFLSTLPEPTWKFDISLQQNEMFILGLEKEGFDEALRNNDYQLLSKHLYRVQSISSNDYWFRLHIETINDKSAEGKLAMKYYRVKSIKALYELNPQKVYINLLGEIRKL